MSDPVQNYINSHDAFEANGAAANPAVGELRRMALERFRALGFPNTKMEDWRFTSTKALVETTFEPAKRLEKVDRGAVNAAFVNGLDSARIVLVNGFYSAELSARELPAGVEVLDLAEAIRTGHAAISAHLGKHVKYETHPFAALNTAFANEGVLVVASKGAVVGTPIEIVHYTEPGKKASVSHPRALIVAEAGSQVAVIETYYGAGGGKYFTNAITEIVCGENAVVDHYKVQREGEDAFHVFSLQAEIARNGNFSTQSVIFGGAFTRNDLGMRLNGEGGTGTMNGLYMISGKQFVDNHTEIDHAMPHCESHELYKGILDDESRGVFNGKIMVRKDAQKTNSKQTNKSLLLSKKALVNTNPQLEIFADDVRCTHGATVGQLDEASLFYLRARGISEKEARNLLTYAFANDLVTRIKIEPLRSALERELLETQHVPVFTGI